MNTAANNTERTLTTGLNGSGHEIWIVSTHVRGSLFFMERFDTKAEAVNWMKWA
jgi:hypothetical protein